MQWFGTPQRKTDQ